MPGSGVAQWLGSEGRHDPALGRPLVVVVAGSAIYGAALGGWHGTVLAVYCAVKLPAVLLLTGAVAFLFNWAAGSALGAPARARDLAALTLSAAAVSSLLLAALAPVVLLFDLSFPAPGTGARTTHNVLYLIHVTLVGGSGLAGVLVLRRTLADRLGSLRTATRIVVVWVAASALVGGEVAWALRPFVGSVYEPVTFVRPDALEGNVYEFVWTDIRPHLLGLEARDDDNRAHRE
jgi:hypothetical protein